jgi:hypothetical protein
MLDYYRSPAKVGQLALIEIVLDSRRDKVIIPHGDHKYKKGVTPKRLIRTFPTSDPFALVIPKEQVDTATSKLKSSLVVHYTWKASSGTDNGEKTQTFWENRRADFVLNFLRKIKSNDTEGTFAFHLVEEGRLVRYANQACRLADTTSAEATFFPIQVFGVYLGEGKETSPFDYK